MNYAALYTKLTARAEAARAEDVAESYWERAFRISVPDTLFQLSARLEALGVTPAEFEEVAP